MTVKNCVQVVIGGKVFQLGGNEDEAHIRDIESYVNNTLEEIYQSDGYRCLPNDMKDLYIYINMADKLLNERDRADRLEAEIQMRDNELAELKKEIVDFRVKLEKTQYQGKK